MLASHPVAFYNGPENNMEKGKVRKRQSTFTEEIAFGLL